MNVVVGSAFRDTSTAGVRRYLRQVADLRTVSGWSVRVIAAEGDSRNGTRRDLQAEAAGLDLDLELVPVDHGHPHFGSTELPLRMHVLSGIANAIFDHVRESDAALLYVESDLIWDGETARRLINSSVNFTGMDVVSPLVFAGPHFYDVWAYRKNGARFAPFLPYHSELAPVGLTEVDSVGSCLAMRGAVARQCRIRDGNALVGWCADARAHGHRIAVAAELRVEHPA